MNESSKLNAATSGEKGMPGAAPPGPQKILIVDDDPNVRGLLQSFLAGRQYDTATAADGEGAIARIRQEVFDLVIVDLVLPGVDGNRVMQEAISLYPDVTVIVISGHATVESAISAMRLGAFDYLTKPFRLSELEVVVQKALERNRLRSENRYLRSQLDARYDFENIVGRSAALEKVFEVVRKIAPTPSTVLITGASGTGKEMIARAIHFHSDRKGKPFVSVNCAAMPETLLEDELFGHKRGAFTDAIGDRAGCFERADGGTFFLDEIGDMSLGLQVKLLRVLQEREFTPLGGSDRIKVDVRILAATNQELKMAIEQRRFREDLYYRLNVIHIHLPTLAERRSDIPLLVSEFLEKFCARNGHPLKRFSQDAMRLLMRYQWPGNIRELENVVERAVALGGSREVLEPSDLPEETQPASSGGFAADPSIEEGAPLARMLERIEAKFVLQALESSRWVKSRAAHKLGIKRTTLVEKMKRLGIPLRHSP